MKKLLLISICTFLFNKTNAQVVFCPPGAEWHYFFEWLGYPPNSIYNESVKYVGDSIDGPDTLKILSHKRFFLECNNVAPIKTLIKQKEDTIFFKNKFTQNTWQILYNFAALAGDSWVTTILQNNNSLASYGYSVTSVQQVTVNGFNLRSLNVNAKMGAYTQTLNITERYGSSGFFFNYRDYGDSWCDADYFGGPLCYKDSTFGIKQFSSMPCDYSHFTGIADLNFTKSRLKLFPNPTSDILEIKLENQNTNENYEFSLRSILGKEILSQQKIKNQDGKFILDLGSVEKGIYFLQVFEKEKLIATQKIVKN